MKNQGFTLLELLIVLFLMTLMLGLSSVFFANTLPSGRFHATAREIAATVRHARSLAQIQGRDQTLLINLDTREYGIKGLKTVAIPEGISIRIEDPFYGDIKEGKYTFTFHSYGSAEGGTIVLWDDKRSVTISLDPVEGSIILKGKT
ncbi:MAG: prepilin-type N-terminal cleavage/methylation domain-containing protein [Candidatus Sulfobium sp.]|jgi:general secretion pathway protein H